MGKTLAELKELVFRQITPADFFNINKPPGTEDRGGGQSYIDVPVRNVDLAQPERKGRFSGVFFGNNPPGIWGAVVGLQTRALRVCKILCLLPGHVDIGGVNEGHGKLNIRRRA